MIKANEMFKNIGFVGCGNKDKKDENFFTYGMLVPFDDNQEIVVFFDKEKVISIWNRNRETRETDYYNHNNDYGYTYMELHNAINQQVQELNWI